MNMLSLRVGVVFAAVVLLGVALFSTSQNVQKAENRLEGIEGDIEKAEKATHVLRAEWAYLNRPQRLEVLARDYLGMDVPSPHNVVQGLDDIDAEIRNSLYPASYHWSVEGSDEGGRI